MVLTIFSATLSKYSLNVIDIWVSSDIKLSRISLVERYLNVSGSDICPYLFQILPIASKIS